MKAKALLVGLGCLLLPWPGTASAARVNGVDFEEAIEVREQPLSLAGAGLLRYRVFIKAYVAALYLPADTSPLRWDEDVPKRLEIEYFWGIPGPKFGEAAEKLLARSQDPTLVEELEPRLERMSALYRDVSPGDRYALTYLPGLGTELSLNGEVLGRVPGADFARAYFGIWLGDDPLDVGLRDVLLSTR